MHPRLSLHQTAFLTERPAAFVEHCRAIGMQHMTLAAMLLTEPDDVEATRRAIAAGAPGVHTLNHVFATFPDIARDDGRATEGMLGAIDIAHRLGAPNIYLLTGGRGPLDWEAAAQRFADLMAPALPVARARGVRLLVETASAFNTDMHMVHTLDDTIRLADIAGIDVCLELHACWYESDLKAKFARALPSIGLVQVSDYVQGDRSAPCRAVPGDGVIPLERLLGDLLELGYEGVFDLELIGPRIDAEGPREATKRGAEYMSELLTRLGA